jgi:hypothetical protein
MKTLKLWTDRFMQVVLIALCLCLAAYLPGQIGIAAAIGNCDFFEAALKTPFAPAPKWLEYRARAKLGCPIR